MIFCYGLSFNTLTIAQPVHPPHTVKNKILSPNTTLIKPAQATPTSSVIIPNTKVSPPPVIGEKYVVTEDNLKVDPQSTRMHPQFGALPFNGARAFAFIKKYVELGHRYYGATQRDIVIQSMSQELMNAHCQVSTQSLEVQESVSQKKYTLYNIIGRMHPEREKRIILGSHWDTRLWAEEDSHQDLRNNPINGANDGTSGLAVIFELALQLQKDPLQNIGIDFILFDGEEFGRPGSQNYCQGSEYFAKHLEKFYPKKNPMAVFIIDMVGRIGTQFAPEKSSFMRSRSLTQVLWREADRLKLPAFKVKNMGPWIIDDHSPFQKKNIPALLLIDYNDRHWHTHQDTLHYCSADSLTQVGRALWASFKRLDQNAKR